MPTRGVVLVTGNTLGDRVAGLLEAAGCQVLRGPKPQLPALTVFPREEWPRWFGEADVIVVSPRDRCPCAAMEAALPAYLKNPDVLPAWRQRLAALGA